MNDDRMYGLQAAEVTRVKAADLMPENTGVMSTARHAVLGGPPSAISDDAVVTVGGIDMRLATAAQLGYVTKDARGDYVDSTVDSSSPAEAAQSPEGARDAESPQPFAPEVEQHAAEFASHYPPEVQDAALSQLLQGGIEALDLTAAPLGGKSPQEYRDGVSAIVEAFSQQAEQFAAARGVDPDAFFGWARSNAAPEFHEAMRKHAYGRNPAVYQGLISRYLQSTAPSTQALNGGGFQTRQDRVQGEMVNIGGQWMAVKVAARLGLI